MKKSKKVKSEKPKVKYHCWNCGGVLDSVKKEDDGHHGICTPVIENTIYDAERLLEYLKA